MAAALLGQGAQAQDRQAKPEVDPDAATYDPHKYSPPGVRKSVEIGNFYLKKKKYNAALSRFQEAMQEDSTYAPAYLGLGKVYEKIGLKVKALDAYKKYLDALPSEKDALDAKDAQRAVARLEAELRKPGIRN
jgi:tetratricopeptide (TPR) repeat protein